MAASKAGRRANASAQEELVITRLLDEPRELVFKVWTDPQHIWRWWGPRDFTTDLVEWDLREGGAWRARMRSPDGKDYWQEGVFLEIVEPERLLFTFIWGSDPGYEMLVAVTLAERDGRTEMTFHKGPFKSVKSQHSEADGWNESFDRLVAYVATPPGNHNDAPMH